MLATKIRLPAFVFLYKISNFIAVSAILKFSNHDS